MNCNFCKQKFSNTSSLNLHQKNAKYCLNLRGVLENKKFKCDYCDKSYTTKQNLTTHYNICKLKKLKVNDENKIISELNKLKSSINNLQTQNSSLKNQTETTAKTNKNLLLNGLVITARSGDGYINATKLCKAGGKEFKHWNSLESTKTLLTALESDVGIATSQLIDIKKGNSIKYSQGSWIHPDLAVQLAQWISPEFSIKVSRWIRETCTELNKLQSSINNLQTQNSSLKNQINNQDMTFKISLENGETMNIGIRSDGYINATELCKAAGKKYNDYQRLKQTEDYFQALSFNTQIPVLDLINSSVGGNHSGTYVHRKVGYHLAQWLSPSFAVQVSNVLDNLFITGKVDLGNENSNTELDNIYQEKINTLQNELENKNNKLKIYETTIFNRKTDYCPIEYYGKDIVYFIKFNIPSHLHDEYISKYPNIDNDDYSCVEFGVSSDIEKRLLSHKRDKKKQGLIFLHAIELNKRYVASKIEFYIKTIALQLNVKFEYEKKKECFIVNEEQFNIIINKINEGITRSITNINEADIEDENLEDGIEDEDINKNIEIIKYKYDIEKELKIKRMENEKDLKRMEIITELFKNKTISFEEYKSMICM